MHGQWLRDPVTFMPRRCQRPERKISPLSKKSNDFSERLLYSWLSKNLFCGPNFGNSSTCALEVFRKRAGGGGGVLMHMNINLDSTNIIITRYKIVASFFLRHFLQCIISVSILGAIFMHTSIFSAWGKMDGWVRVLRPFNSISVISRRWKGEHERLCAMKRRLGSGRISPPAGFEPVTPWSEVAWGKRAAEYFEFGVCPSHKYIHIHVSKIPCIYTC